MVRSIFAATQKRALRLTAFDITPDLEASLRLLGREYLAHRFDLLGSGWVSPEYGFRAAGFLKFRYAPAAPPAPNRAGNGLERLVNRANLARAREAWGFIANPDYRPIDWQLDFRSGRRWKGRRHSYGQRLPVDTGADVKVPWELARLQHLPQLAFCAILATAGNPGFSPAMHYQREISDQLLDFIATNPPRFGVNWMSAMDVAIRAANIALTLALLAGVGSDLDPAVESIVLAALRDHAAHVFSHLDHSETGRNNHYLADLAGLLWAGWTMAPGNARDRWLYFAASELGNEIGVQFLPDGGNYEGSTGYHRLSSEMILFSVGVLRALGREVPVEMLATLRKAATLSRAITGADGTVVQIGDTDSGRFFKLHPVALPESLGGKRDIFVENVLDHEGFAQGVDALFQHPASGSRLDAMILARLSTQTYHLQDVELKVELQDFGDLGMIERKIAEIPESSRRVRRLTLPRAVEPSSWRRNAFPDFGLYIFRGEPDLLVAFRCWKGPAPGAPTGHSHDDNLGLEYRLGPVESRDPGSFVYTPSVKLRNAYRAASAHDVPRSADWELAKPGRELFVLDHRAFASCLAWGQDGVAGEIQAPWGRILRLIRLTHAEITVTDVITPARAFAAHAGLKPSLGYGRLAPGSD